jgi:hypothetical protein
MVSSIQSNKAMFSVRSQLRWREEQWRRQAPDVLKLGRPPMLQRQQAHSCFLVVEPEQASEQVLVPSSEQVLVPSSEQVLVLVIDLPEVQSPPPSPPLSPPLSPPREYSEDNFDVLPDAHLFKC